MSAFALPIPPGGVTPLPSQAYGTLRYRLQVAKPVNPRLRQMA